MNGKNGVLRSKEILMEVVEKNYNKKMFLK